MTYKNTVSVQVLISSPPEVDETLRRVDKEHMSFQVIDERDNRTAAWIVPDALMRALAPGMYQ
jgi:hypothetical protein